MDTELETRVKSYPQSAPHALVRENVRRLAFLIVYRSLKCDTLELVYGLLKCHTNYHCFVRLCQSNK